MQVSRTINILILLTSSTMAAACASSLRRQDDSAQPHCFAVAFVQNTPEELRGIEREVELTYAAAEGQTPNARVAKPTKRAQASVYGLSYWVHLEDRREVQVIWRSNFTAIRLGFSDVLLRGDSVHAAGTITLMSDVVDEAAQQWPVDVSRTSCS